MTHRSNATTPRTRAIAAFAALAFAAAAAGIGGAHFASADDAATATASAFVPLVPARVLDTRTGQGGDTLGPDGELTLPIAGVGGVAADATAVQLNVTVTNGTEPSYLTVWPSGAPRPVASSLNWADGAAHPNGVTATIGTDGAVALYNFAGSVDVIADVVGYYVPGAGSGERGPAGPGGPSGPAGPVGPAGPRGDAGAPGAVGPAGATGATGAQGPAGPRGLQAPRGRRARPGRRGRPGRRAPPVRRAPGQSSLPTARSSRTAPA